MSKSTFSVTRLSLLCLLFLSEPSASFAPPRTTAPFTAGTSTSRSTSSTLQQRHATSSNNNHHYEEEDEEEERRYQDWRIKQEDIEKKVRLQIKADEEKEKEKELNLFDLTEEMSRVESIAPGLPLDAPEQHVDDHISQLEGELYAASSRHDFTKAQAIQDEISQFHLDDCGAVLQVNSAYYRAFSDKNYTAMENIWLHDASALCIHPSHKALIGAPAVLDAWKGMFESSVGSAKNWMEPSNIKLVVKGTTAIVSCDENVYARRFVRGQRRETELVNRLTATNIFRKVGRKWFLVHHHASWHADSEASRMAMTVGGGPKTRSSKFQQHSAVDGIMGSKDFGPYLGSPSPDKPAVKKIIMGGSLSDLLSGNIGDILSGPGNESDDSGAIIKISGPIMGDLDDDDDDEDDDDDLDDDVEDVDEEVSTFVKELHMLREQNSKSSKSKKASAGGSKDTLRQSCIMALRKLCDQGAISQKQKRVLLTDIISCSARGEYSMVEVAYELLCGEGDDKDVADEEFADQCRVFFESLS